jgi:predicted nuclease of predicted toxin-antitoxin system
MKFLVDESVGIEVSLKLKQMSFDTISVIHSMRGANDEEIIRRAIDENRVIITNDKDFGWLASLYKPPGIILLRLKDERPENKVKMVSHIS